MDDLEKLLHDAAARGQLNHVSLHAKDVRGKGVMFSATFRDTRHDGHRFALNADPVAALKEALTAKVLRAKRNTAESADDDFG